MTQTNARILVIDDDEDIRQLMTLFLEAEGYGVDVAADGSDAWKQLQAGIRPELIILDLMMPGMDGEHFLKKLRASRFANTRVIILSGHGAAQQKVTELKANGCLMKPVELDDLLSTIKRFLPAHLARRDRDGGGLGRKAD
jgi:DNA-binding response OmpR family regulator